MKVRFFPTVLILACLTARALAEDANSDKTATTEATRALLREDAKNKAAHPVPTLPPTLSPATDAADPAKPPAPDRPAALLAPVSAPPVLAPVSIPATTTTPGALAPVLAPTATALTKDNPAKPAAAAPTSEPATMLPPVEVNRSKINEINREILKQDKDIAREKKLTKSTELDKALNDPKVSIPILGGQTTTYKTSIANERVGLMEDERDILEEMKLAKTKEEKAELQKELDEIRVMRRDLEKNLR